MCDSTGSGFEDAKDTDVFHGCSLETHCFAIKSQMDPFL